MQLASHTLNDGDGSVTLLNLGCITQDWRVPLNGGRVPVVLGYADPQDYAAGNPCALGIIAGRVANRISGARFTLDGTEIRLVANEGPNQLHGGPEGLGRQVWDMTPDGTRAVRFTHRSPDGAQGYPGTVDFTVTVTLDGSRLTYVIEAVPDRPTPINLAQHNYYNLMGSGAVWDHVLRVGASHFTPVRPDMCPTGAIAVVDRTPFDFRTPHMLGTADPGHAGTDANLVLDPADPGTSQADLTAPNGLRLRLWTDQPGLQLYTGQHLRPGPTALPGQRHDPFHGICLEPQHFPDAVNIQGFPSIVCTPEQPYKQTLSIEIEAQP